VDTQDKVESINVADEFIEAFISLSGNSCNAAHHAGQVKTNWSQQQSNKSDKGNIHCVLIHIKWLH